MCYMSSSVVTFCITGIFMFLLTAFTSLIPFAVCSFVFGFFNAASSPTVNECVLVVAGPDYFNFGFGQASVFNGIGIVLGAPIAGIMQILTDRYSSINAWVCREVSLALLRVKIADLRSRDNNIKKVLLPECKRHTAHRVASTLYAVPVGGTPSPILTWDLDGGGYSHPANREYPHPANGRVPHPDLLWDTPVSRMGVPHPT